MGIFKAAPVPAPLVRTIPAPVPVVKSVPATPLPVLRAAPVFAPQPLPAFRVTPPVAQPIVAESVKPVTYTHLGAHPIQPLSWKKPVKLLDIIFFKYFNHLQFNLNFLKIVTRNKYKFKVTKGTGYHPTFRTLTPQITSICSENS